MLYIVFGLNRYGDIITLPYNDINDAMRECDRQNKDYKDDWTIKCAVRTTSIIS